MPSIDVPVPKPKKKKGKTEKRREFYAKLGLAFSVIHLLVIDLGVCVIDQTYTLDGRLRGREGRRSSSISSGVLSERLQLASRYWVITM